MADELWSAKLTRENIGDFYNSTVVMVYSAVLSITKESTRCENAIVKSYLDVYSKRSTIPAEKVVFVFGDILLDNAKKIVEDYPLPADITYSDRLLDEYTRNSMLEKIVNKIDSKSFKMVEFISSDMKKSKGPKTGRKIGDLFTVTPLLFVEVIALAILIWIVSYAAVSLPYSNKQLIDEQSIFESASVQDKYITAMGFFPLNVAFPAATADAGATTDPNAAGETVPSDTAITDTTTGLAPVIATTQETQVSATSG